MKASGYIVASVNDGPYVSIPFRVDTRGAIVVAHYGENGDVFDASTPHPVMRDFYDGILTAISEHQTPSLLATGD